MVLSRIIKSTNYIELRFFYVCTHMETLQVTRNEQHYSFMV